MDAEHGGAALSAMKQYGEIVWHRSLYSPPFQPYRCHTRRVWQEYALGKSP